MKNVHNHKLRKTCELLFFSLPNWQNENMESPTLAWVWQVWHFQYECKQMTLIESNLTMFIKSLKNAPRR